MNLAAKLRSLLSHLNSEENEMALELLEELVEADQELSFLNALRNAGVDNWDGYSYAQEQMDDEEDGDDE